MTEKVLIVEDEPALLDTLAYNLSRQGYLVETASNGFNALEVARSELPDLILLDIMLPGLDGLEVCRVLRQEMNVPILMLTARDDEIERVIGLELGADDYITKPFSMRELIARVKAHLRRVRLIRDEIDLPPAEGNYGVLRFDNLEIILNRREVLLDMQPLTLKPKEYELILFLAQHHRQALSREKILENVWGWNYVGGSRTVDVHIGWLRSKIEPDPTHPSRIITIRGAGYRFEG